MALGMMRQISANIQNATFFTIVADETADVSYKEQLVFFFAFTFGGKLLRTAKSKQHGVQVRTMEFIINSTFSENYLLETSDNVIQKR